MFRTQSYLAVISDSVCGHSCLISINIHGLIFVYKCYKLTLSKFATLSESLSTILANPAALLKDKITVPFNVSVQEE